MSGHRRRRLRPKRSTSGCGPVGALTVMSAPRRHTGSRAGNVAEQVYTTRGGSVGTPLRQTWRMRWSAVPTGMGDVGVAADEYGVCAVTFAGPGGPVEASPDAVLADAVRQLTAYFAGELTDFSLPLHVSRGTPFERAVWERIARIPYGETQAYGAIANAVAEAATAPGDLPARAVGVACNRNPLPIVVPCHRVVGAGGKLVGFGGGLPRKRFLLELEARVQITRDFGLAPSRDRGQTGVS